MTVKKLGGKILPSKLSGERECVEYRKRCEWVSLTRCDQNWTVTGWRGGSRGKERLLQERGWLPIFFSLLSFSLEKNFPTSLSRCNVFVHHPHLMSGVSCWIKTQIQLINKFYIEIIILLMLNCLQKLRAIIFHIFISLILRGTLPQLWNVYKISNWQSFLSP